MPEKAEPPRVDRLARGELAQLQYQRLYEQLQRVYAVSSFYRHHFDRAGFSPEKLRSINDIQAVPFLVKSDLIRDQEANPPLGTRLCAPEQEIGRFEITSGTSGLGQEAYGLTSRDMETIGSMAGWAMSMGGITSTDRVAATLPLGYLQGPWGAQWGAQSIGAAILHLGLATDTATKIRYLQRFEIAAIYGLTPTFLMRMAKVAGELGLDPRQHLAQLRRIWIMAESYPVEWISRTEQHWGLELREVYGSTGGAYAVSCEKGLASDGHRGYLHNADWNVLLEVIDPETGQPVAEGEIGEAVITTLVRQASPLIRFRTGDRVRLLAHDGCLCGRQTAAIEAGTIGRLDDMLKLKGMNVWPSAVDEIVLGAESVEEYNATVGLDDRGYEYVHLDVVLSKAIPTADRAAHLSELKRRLRSATNVSMELREAEMDSMRTFEYKARRWQDKRSVDLLATPQQV